MKIRNVAAAALALALAACAPEVVRHPAQLAAGPSGHRFVSERAVTAPVNWSYHTEVPAGVEFVELGTIGEGRVLKPLNRVITVESANVHEAYPVVDQGRLVGFYLPYEHAFSPIHPAPEFPLKEQGRP